MVKKRGANRESNDQEGSAPSKKQKIKIQPSDAAAATGAPTAAATAATSNTVSDGSTVTRSLGASNRTSHVARTSVSNMDLDSVFGSNNHVSDGAMPSTSSSKVSTSNKAKPFNKKIKQSKKSKDKYNKSKQTRAKSKKVGKHVQKKVKPVFEFNSPPASSSSSDETDDDKGSGTRVFTKKKKHSKIQKKHSTRRSKHAKNYKLYHYRTRLIKKYKITETIYRVKFSSKIYGKQIIEIDTEMRNLFQDLLDSLNSQYHQDDLVRIYINHPDFQYSIPVFLALRPLRTLTVDAIFQILEKILNSNTSLRMSKDFRIDVGIVLGNHAGASWRKFVTNIDKKMKKSIICIERLPDDYTCLSRAILVALDDKREKSRGKKTKLTEKRKKQVLRKKALDLLKKVGLPSDRHIYLNEIHLFEDFLNVQIIMYDRPLSGSTVYTGKVDRQQKIFLYHNDNHCDVISSIAGFLSKAKYCMACLKAYKSSSRHDCEGHCKICESAACKLPDVEEQKLVCKNCFIECRNVTCFKTHRTGSNPPCERFRACKTCKRTCPLQEFKKHLCGSRTCAMCGEQVVGKHLCYMRKNEPRQTLGKFIYYDFECTQDSIFVCEKGYLPRNVRDCSVCSNAQVKCPACLLCTNCKKSTCGMARHVPDYVVSQSVCNVCSRKNLSPDSSCDSCGSRCDVCGAVDKDGSFKRRPCQQTTCGKRERIFQGLNTLSLFAEWLFTKHHKGFKAIAHNSSSYDGVFLLNYLVNETHSQVSTLYRGTKILSLTVPEYDIQIIDSLCFFPFSLKNLGKSFGLSIEKGDFPHKFNRFENFNYVGKYPDVSFYGIDEMKEKDRESFLLWYESKKK